MIPIPAKNGIITPLEPRDKCGEEEERVPMLLKRENGERKTPERNGSLRNSPHLAIRVSENGAVQKTDETRL